MTSDLRKSYLNLNLFESISKKAVVSEMNGLRNRLLLFPNLAGRRLKLVSTLERNFLIRRIDTTTLNHLTAMLWYHIKHQLSVKKIRSFL